MTILKKVGKLSFNFIFILFIILSLLFIGLKKTHAAESDIVLNEVMVDPAPQDTTLCKNDSCEWIEIYNKNDVDINLKDWTIDNKLISNNVIILAKDYLVITKNIIEFNKIWTVDQTKIIQLNIGLTNSGDSLTITSDTGNYTEDFSWATSAGSNISWEKIDPKIESDDNWHESLVFGGTPNAKNSVTDLKSPNSPALLSPFSGKQFNEKNIQFTWFEPDPNIIFEFILSQNANLADPLLNQQKILNSYFEIDDLDYGTYYWKVIASNGLYETSSVINSFTINEPKYCEEIIISEILPNPTGDQLGEWIELYNGSDDDVNLLNWSIEDLKGSTHKYIISNDLIIPTKKYIIIFRTQSGITLNDDNDSLVLYQPNGKLQYQTAEYKSAKDGIAWARGPDGNWYFTSTPTPATINKITQPISEDISLISANDQDINTTPIEIPTGDYRKYHGMLVKIRGEVVETSGDTFYIDDGSGPVKIYIQEKTGITKPEMHKGDIFEIIGIVDLFGTTNWRILPKTDNDIKLIESATKIVLSSSAKTSTKKASTAPTSTTKTTSNSNKKIAGILTNNLQNSDIKSNSTKDPFWYQIIKMISGFALIVLVLLIIKIRRMPKEKVVGGNFGDDFT